jgi:hypothetical protein
VDTPGRDVEQVAVGCGGATDVLVGVGVGVGVGEGVPVHTKAMDEVVDISWKYAGSDTDVARKVTPTVPVEAPPGTLDTAQKFADLLVSIVPRVGTPATLGTVVSSAPKVPGEAAPLSR